MAKYKDPMTIRIAKKYSQKVTPAQDKFGSGLGRVVNKFVDVNNPKRK